jgi:hypothetical protein
VHLDRQSLTLTLDRVIVRHACDYGPFRGLRLSPVKVEWSALC